MRQLLERLRDLNGRLKALDLAAARQATCETIGKYIEAAVLDALSHQPGDEHTTPWERTGALRASIDSEVTETAITVGSTDPAAVFQEEGTRTLPPRPFLAPAAVAASADAAAEIGTTTAEALRVATR